MSVSIQLFVLLASKQLNFLVILFLRQFLVAPLTRDFAID